MDNIVSAFDVAVYILQKQGEMTAMKLQKLLYYCQAWSLVWDEAPVFNEEIQAWANGPVIPDIFYAHQGKFIVTKEDFPKGNAEKLNGTQRKTIDAVLDYYGNKPSQWLSDLTHMEDPWKETRKGLSALVRSNRVISHSLIAEYYSSIPEEK